MMDRSECEKQIAARLSEPRAHVVLRFLDELIDDVTPYSITDAAGRSYGIRLFRSTAERIYLRGHIPTERADLVHVLWLACDEGSGIPLVEFSERFDDQALEFARVRLQEAIRALAGADDETPLRAPSDGDPLASLVMKA